MFLKRRKIEDVRAKLISLIADAKRSLERNSTDSHGAGAGPQRDFRIIVSYIHPEDLVPAAREIITKDVANRVEQLDDESQRLLDLDVYPHILAEDVDLFLGLVLATVESWLGPENGRFRYIVAIAGSNFHNDRGMKRTKEQAWVDAESEFRQAVEYNRLTRFANQNLTVNLLCLSNTLLRQESYPEAKKVIEEGLAEFAKLQQIGARYEGAAQLIQPAKENLDILKRSGY